MITMIVINLQRVSPVRVTVLGLICLFVCQVTSHLWSVCLSWKRCHVLSGQRNFVGIFLKRLRSRVMLRTNIPTYPLSAFSQRSAIGYPTIINNIRPCPKTMPTDAASQNWEHHFTATHEAWPISTHTRIGTVQCAEGFALHLFVYAHLN